MASQIVPDSLCLHVVVVSASGLYKKDLFGLCDPYVKVSLKKKKGTAVEQTRRKKKNLNPEWNEKFVFNDINLTNDSILFEVFDENRLTRDNFLGKLHFKLHHIPIEMKKTDIHQYDRTATYPLKPRSHKSRVSGTLTIKFLYYNNPPSRMGSAATLMGELNLASLVEGSTGQTSPHGSQRIVAHEQAGSAGVSNSPQPSTTDFENEDEPLPEGWLERLDANGRTFYVDHINRRTQWERPTGSAEVGARQRRAQMESDRRRMMAQTLARRNPGMSGSESVLDLSMTSSGGSSGLTNGRPPSSYGYITAASSSQHTITPVQVAPPLPPRSVTVSTHSVAIPRLLPPPRSFSLDNAPSSASNPTPTNPSMLSATSTASTVPIVSPPPSSPSPSSLQDDVLPEGWERRTATNGRPFYIDHNTRKTQWYKPTGTVRPRPQSAIFPSASSVSSIATPISSRSSSPTSQTLTVNGTTLNSLRSTNNVTTQPVAVAAPTSVNSRPPVQDIPVKDLGPLPSGWEMRLLPDGRKFFIEHATHSTQWEDPRLQKQKQEQQVSNTPYSVHYKQKFDALRKHLITNKPENLPRIFEIPIRRQQLFEDSHRTIMNCKNKNFLKARLWVKFDGEKGLDYGGVSREWFFLLSHEMFNPYYGLFEYAASDNYTLQINPESGFCNENHLEYFRFIGRILAMAIYHQRLIDAFFVRPFYKMLAGKKIILDDMEMVDTEFYNSIKYVLENDPEPLCLSFTANREFVGQVEEVELKPGGTDIDITEENKMEYIDLLMKWRFENRIQKQMDSLKKGFNDVISTKLLSPFDAQEIEYLICGIGEINVEDWRKNTVYSAGYTPEDNVIIWFWKAVQTFDSELQARLLQFVTGTSKVPMNGFAELQGSNGSQKFCIKKLGDPTSLPRSHTCFNRIDLPPYRSYHEMKEKLRLAIENTEGFEGVD